jgi:hypothetical protein
VIIIEVIQPFCWKNLTEQKQAPPATSTSILSAVITSDHVSLCAAAVRCGAAHRRTGEHRSLLYGTYRTCRGLCLAFGARTRYAAYRSRL